MRRFSKKKNKKSSFEGVSAISALRLPNRRMSIALHARALAPVRCRQSETRSVVARAVRHPASSTSEPPASTSTSRRLALVIASVGALASVPRAARALESYSGVGLEIFVGPDGAVKVVEAFGAGYAKKAGPAYEAGVRVNDAIVSVDGKTTARLGGLEGTASALRGPTGSAVTVEVERRVKGGKRVAEALELVRANVDPSARSCFVSTCRRA